MLPRAEETFLPHGLINIKLVHWSGLHPVNDTMIPITDM